MKDETHHPPAAGNTSPESRSLTLTRTNTTCLSLSGAVVASALQNRLSLLEVQSLTGTETDSEVASSCEGTDIRLTGHDEGDDVIRWAGAKTDQHDGDYKLTHDSNVLRKESFVFLRDAF